jgi:hypothetical protein
LNDKSEIIFEGGGCDTPETLPAFEHSDWGIPRNTPLSIGVDPNEIRTKYLLIFKAAKICWISSDFSSLGVLPKRENRRGLGLVIEFNGILYSA